VWVASFQKRIEKKLRASGGYRKKGCAFFIRKNV